MTSAWTTFMIMLTGTGGARTTDIRNEPPRKRNGSHQWANDDHSRPSPS